MADPIDYSKELTVVVPIRNRPEFSRRWLRYILSKSPTFKFIIADGSIPGQDSGEIFRSVGKRLNLEYIRYPADMSLDLYFSKMVDVLSKVTTPYTLLSCNDDFPSISGTVRALNFLKENSEYSCARGKIVNFQLHPTADSTGNINKTFGSVSHEGIQYPKDISTASNILSERLFDMFAEGIAVPEALHRTENLLDGYRALRDLRIDSLEFEGQFTGFAAGLRGKIYRGDYFFLYRQDDSPDGAGKMMLEKNPTQLHFVTSGSWISQSQSLLDFVLNGLAKSGFLVTHKYAVDFAARFYRHELLEPLSRKIEYDSRKQSSKPFSKSITGFIIEKLKSLKFIRFLRKIIPNRNPAISISLPNAMNSEHSELRSFLKEYRP